MEELYKSGGREHRLILENRGGLTLSGVVDIISFDLNEVLMETAAGMLTVQGQDLHVNKLLLEKGEVDISGTVDSLLYSDVSSYGEKAGSFLRRLFQ
ncbi:MAG: sporulation protein YabP [Lachnospiraceae bacterium]|nr:sporulation protein YabP [Lachnospiraceae bacterium]